ncbi:MAG TPA: TonB family protein, partial [Pyrinomonadaceae bacterium]|nr:TonB family protein [Pyrinomonadaceae bacterium]
YYPRRAAGQQLSSSVSGNFVSEQAAQSEPPSDLNPPLTMPRELAVRSTITFGGPAHGSKNMNPDTSGDPQPRNERDVRVTSPAAPATVEAKTASNIAPRDTEPPPVSKAEPPDAKTGEGSSPQQQQPTDGGDEAAEPQPTPKPTPTQANAPAPTSETNAPQSSQSQSTPQPSPSQSSKESPQTSTPQNGSPNTPKTPLSVGLLNSRALSLPKPIYPPMGRQLRVEGVVKVSVVVDEAGKVISARAESGHTLLQAAAVQAARQARFAPTLVAGQPVAISGFITYTFTL